MLKGLLAFALSRRPIILLSLGAFVVAGLIAFSKLNIEAYPNPAPAVEKANTPDIYGLLTNIDGATADVRIGIADGGVGASPTSIGIV